MGTSHQGEDRAPAGSGSIRALPHDAPVTTLPHDTPVLPHDTPVTTLRQRAERQEVSGGRPGIGPRLRKAGCLWCILLVCFSACDPSPEARDLPEPRVPMRDADLTQFKPRVRHAYLELWRVLRHAARHLELDHLDDAFSGQTLTYLRERLGNRAWSGRALALKVEHDYTVRMISPEHAEVRDRYVVRRTHVHSLSGDVLDRMKPLNNAKTFELRLVDGAWKMTQGRPL